MPSVCSKRFTIGKFLCEKMFSQKRGFASVPESIPLICPFRPSTLSGLRTLAGAKEAHPDRLLLKETGG